MAGNQSRALVIASKMKGWDPTVVPGYGSIANFDYDPGNYPQRFTGTLPDADKLDWADGYDVPQNLQQTFAVPTPKRNTRTVNADPTPAEPGA